MKKLNVNNLHKHIKNVTSKLSLVKYGTHIYLKKDKKKIETNKIRKLKKKKELSKPENVRNCRKLMSQNTIDLKKKPIDLKVRFLVCCSFVFRGV